MPTFPTAELPVPESWDEFEAIVADVMKQEWSDPYITRNGRQGQRQDGVDIYGSPDHLDRGTSGIQCKNTSSVDIQLVEDEVEKAKDFTPPLDEYIFTCTAPSDARLQEEVRELALELRDDGLFELRIMFWDDISLALSEHRDLLRKHYPQFVEESETLESVKKKIIESDLDDWEYDDTEGRYVFTQDVALRIEKQEHGGHEEFHEEWAEDFPDPDAKKFTIQIYYESTPVLKEYIIAVDGYRAYIPIPDRFELTISEFQHNLGEILNIAPGWDYYRYLNRAGVSVE